uniref:Uncharacterized protein n=1 Tax=Anguilla anguilla TaxID=7936 RepID=A0A0E9XR39_ANGAN
MNACNIAYSQVIANIVYMADVCILKFTYFLL